MIHSIHTVGSDVTGYTTPQVPIFLAGPIERVPPYGSKLLPQWRKEALHYLEASPILWKVLTPEWDQKPEGWTYEKQVMWEVTMMGLIAKVILFWIPRQIPALPGFTTNVEVGEYLRSGKIVIGAPPDAPHIHYIKMRCEWLEIRWHDTLKATCLAAERRVEHA
jgi:hypothetical protein